MDSKFKQVRLLILFMIFQNYIDLFINLTILTKDVYINLFVMFVVPAMIFLIIHKGQKKNV